MSALLEQAANKCAQYWLIHSLHCSHAERRAPSFKVTNHTSRKCILKCQYYSVQIHSVDTSGFFSNFGNIRLTIYTVLIACCKLQALLLRFQIEIWPRKLLLLGRQQLHNNLLHAAAKKKERKLIKMQSNDFGRFP